MKEVEAEKVEHLKRKLKNKRKKAGTSKGPEVIFATSEVERLSIKVAEKKKIVKEGIHHLKENMQLLLLANELNKELREEKIEQGAIQARLRPMIKERIEEEECRLTVIATEFKELLKDSDVDRISIHQEKCEEDKRREGQINK